MNLKKAIEKLAGKQTALNDGTPINPVTHGAYDGSELFYGEVKVLNEETAKEKNTFFSN